jgi:hypothetical protein
MQISYMSSSTIFLLSITFISSSEACARPPRLEFNYLGSPYNGTELTKKLDDILSEVLNVLAVQKIPLPNAKTQNSLELSAKHRKEAAALFQLLESAEKYGGYVKPSPISSGIRDHSELERLKTLLNHVNESTPLGIIQQVERAVRFLHFIKFDELCLINVIQQRRELLIFAYSIGL